MTSSRKLRTHVMVHDPATLRPTTFGPEDEVPDWAIPLITVPGVWEDEDVIRVTVGGNDGAGPSTADMLAAMVNVSDDLTREQLLDVAKRMGLKPGEHFNKTANKDTILAAIRHRGEELRGAP